MEEPGGSARRAHRHPGDHVGELADRRVREHPLDVVLHERHEGGTGIAIAPITPTICRTKGSASTNTMNRRPTRYTPAATIVAAWIRAETGGAPPSRRGATRAAGTGPTCRSSRRTAGARPPRRGRRTPPLAIISPISWMLAVVNPVTNTRTKIEHERDVADPRRDERLDRRARVHGVFPPVPDQQVGADPHDLPADEELEQVGRKHDDEHRAREQGQDDVEPGVPDVPLHVAERVHVDAQGDRRDDHEHHGGEAVHEHAGLDVQRSDLEPRHRGLVEALAPATNVHSTPSERTNDAPTAAMP